MAKKKIVMKVQINCDKCRTKAMEVAATAEGVTSVAMEGEEKVAVEGEGVDASDLCRQMRKKLGHADIISVADVKEEKKEEKKEETKEEKKNPPDPQWIPCPCPPYPYYVTYETVYEPSPSICSIL